MSAIDFSAKVDKVSNPPPDGSTSTPFIYPSWQVENPKGDRVKLTLEGKFLPYTKW